MTDTLPAEPVYWAWSRDGMETCLTHGYVYSRDYELLRQSLDAAIVRAEKAEKALVIVEEELHEYKMENSRFGAGA